MESFDIRTWYLVVADSLGVVAKMITLIRLGI